MPSETAEDGPCAALEQVKSVDELGTNTIPSQGRNSKARQQINTTSTVGNAHEMQPGNFEALNAADEHILQESSPDVPDTKANENEI